MPALLPPGSRILLVDDETEIREPLALWFRRQGVQTGLAASAAEARRILAREPVSLVVLDIMMPGEDGLSLCRHLAATGGPPVILLTARAGDEDRIGGLDTGADDYIAKPFNPRELLSRIAAVLRRVPPAPGAVAPRRRRFAGIVHDPANCKLILADGRETRLTTGENRLLSALLDEPGVVFTRERLTEIVRRREAKAFERTVDNLISRLRRKLGDSERQDRLIVTEWGGGYRLQAEVGEL